MKTDAVTLTIGSSTLRAVPAVHYRLFFARAMNKICIDPRTRPEAIAVELNPEAASAIAGWIRELRADQGALPVMLALMMKNHVIRPSLRERAILLQEKTGQDLSELPPELLKHELDFCSEAILPLSPTDSIIEGIRCAVEYKIPIYGIDLENMADEDRGAPKLLPKQLESFSGDVLDQCIDLAANMPVGESDQRREYAMAARLKTLLRNHGSVLFTCGLAHWQRIRNLIHQPEVRPAPVQKDTEVVGGRIRRVIVEPRTAVQFMDLFPALARAWEEYRNKMEDSKAFPDPQEIFDGILQRAYEVHFLGLTKPSPLARGDSASPDSCGAFERYLLNLAMLENSPVPNMFLAISAARETMDPEFVRTLSKIFMDYPWANRSDFPADALAVVGDAGSNDGTMVLKGSSEKEDRYVRPIKPAGPPVELPREEDIRKLTDRDTIGEVGTFSWLPWDRLVTAASIRAIDASRKHKGFQPAPFTGDIPLGIDMKATLRSRARGSAKLYVREQTLEYAPSEETLDAFPVVWIFSQEPFATDDWNVQIFASRYLRPHARDKELFDRKIGSSVMIPLLGYVHREDSDDRSLLSSDYFSGMTVYHPSCFTNRQHALWLERTGYRRAPINDRTTFESFFMIFKERYNINLMEYNWKTSLILSAIPYTAGIVTVVAPDGYRIEDIVLRTARRFNVLIRRSRLSLFSEKERTRLRRCHFAPCLDLEPVCLYSEKVEKIIGERQTDYIQLVPREVVEFGQFA